MASQDFITQLETQVTGFSAVIGQARYAMRHEAEQGGGKVYPENRDYWGTLSVNLHQLARDATKLAEEIEAKL